MSNITHSVTATGGDSAGLIGQTAWNNDHTITAPLTLPAGGTGAAALTLTSGTVKTSPGAGDVEFDGTCIYGSPVAGARGVIPCTQLAAIQSNLSWSYTSATTPIALFDSANDLITLAASTAYLVEGQFIISAGITTHTTSLEFVAASGLSVTNFEYLATLWGAAANTIATAQSTTHVSGIAAKAITATATTAYTIIQINGILRVNVGGTLQPCFRVSADPGTTRLINVGTYIKFTPIGSGTVQKVGNWA